MKKICLLLFWIFSVTLHAQEQLYVYQKDGAVKCFLCEDVDSIVYSRIDLAGVSQEDFVTQKICFQDTVIVMPITSIDSVSFQKPETVLCEDVIALTPDFLQYVTGSEEDTVLYVSSSIPQQLLPGIGQILYYEKSSLVLPNGFVGRITDLSNESGCWKIKTEIPSILEVYERFILAEPYLSGKTENKLKASNIYLYNNTFEQNIDPLGLWTTLTLTVYESTLAPPVMVIDNNQLKYFYLMFDCGLDVSAGLSLGYDKEIDTSLSLCPQVKIPINTLFSLKLDPAVYAKLDGLAELDYSCQNKFRERFGVVFNEGKWMPFAHPVFSDPGKPSTDMKLNLAGSIGVGLQFGVGIGFTIGGGDIGLKGRVGSNLLGNLVFDIGEASDPKSFYSANKESKIGTNVDWSISEILPRFIKDRLMSAGFEAKWNISGKFAEDYSYVFPDFTQPKVDYKNAKGTDIQVTTTASRKVFINPYIGLALYKDKESVALEGQQYYKGTDLLLGANFKALEENVYYRTLPVISLFGKTFLGDQVTGFTVGSSPSLLGTWVYTDGSYILTYTFYGDGTYKWEDNDDIVAGGDSSDNQGSGYYTYDPKTGILSFIGEESFKIKLTENTFSIYVDYGDGSGETWVFYRQK